MEQESIDRNINILSEMIELIEEECNYAVIKEIEYQVDEAKEEVLLNLTLNRGTRDYRVVMNWWGHINQLSKNMPSYILKDIHNAVCAGYLRSIYAELKLQRDDGLQLT